MTWTAVISVAAVFSWLGMAAGISLIEAPLKFRAPGITLALQYLILRPALDRRTAVIIAGGQPPRSALHLGYIAAECAKLVLLLALGLLLARGAA